MDIYGYGKPVLSVNKIKLTAGHLNSQIRSLGIYSEAWEQRREAMGKEGSMPVTDQLLSGLHEVEATHTGVHN